MTRVLRQVVAEAQVRGAAATIAVVDRVGNVLAVYRMTGADDNVLVDAGRGDLPPPSGLAGIELPIAGAAAIAKAITGAYLSSGGNAFSTRTASAIVQENFIPGSRGVEGGPLFGVQFSQLPCSDLSVRFASDNGGTIDPRIGPKRSPLGLSADAGGLPLYENGTLVGGIGVIADGIYGLDRNVRDRDHDLDELIALAGTVGFDAPVDLRAERVAVDGRLLRYADASTGDLRTRPADANQVDLAAAGAFVPVRGYYTAGGPLAGQAFGFGASGIRRAPPGLFNDDRAFMLATAAGINRFPPRAGTDGPGALTEAEVTGILSQALGVALAARGQIRRPLGSNAEVTISVVDTTGEVLGVIRTPDAPIFGTDVSLQKARSAMFFSSPAAPADLASVPRPPAVPQEDGDRELGTRPGAYVNDLRAFAGANAIGGAVAYSSRSIGNLARPFYPDGRNNTPNGPLSVPFERWSPFYTGLQFDLIGGDIVQHVLFVLEIPPGGIDTAPRCAGLDRLANGLQIFPGGVPIYRDGVLVGGVGVSGDGIDQDDMIAFLGLDRAGRALDTGIGNAPREIRSDRLTPRGINLRYVQCPFAPFLGSDQQNVCQGR
ncbi:MAG TPA: heme-binding protein [Geminicoccaceae bacterium]|nr:heme-binding protein [Geminicoccaceae bacterium]